MSLQIRHPNYTLITDLRANQRKGVVSSVNDQRRLKIESNGGVFIPKRCEYYISNMGKNTHTSVTKKGTSRCLDVQSSMLLS